MCTTGGCHQLLQAAPIASLPLHSSAYARCLAGLAGTSTESLHTCAKDLKQGHIYTRCPVHFVCTACVLGVPQDCTTDRCVRCDCGATQA